MTLAAMTAAASQLDNAAPDDVEITDSSAAAEYIADGCLVDGPLGRVGLEMEAHCFDPADPFRRPAGKRSPRFSNGSVRCRAAAWSAWSPVVPSNCPDRPPTACWQPSVP